MERNIKEINEKLNEMQEAWFNDIAKKIYDSYTETKYSLSSPFYSRLLNNHNNNKRIVMIVGQEVGAWSEYKENDKWNNPEKSSRWSAYWTLLKQGKTIENIKSIMDIDDDFTSKKHKNSPFWNFINKFDGNKYTIFWTNLDKVHSNSFLTSYSKKSNDFYIFKDKLKELNEKFIYNNKELSILQHEIEIVKPDIVIFTTGSNNVYVSSMEKALDIKLNYAPTYSKQHTNLNDALKVIENTNYFWTYHPKFLSISGLWYNVIDEIKKHI